MNKITKKIIIVIAISCIFIGALSTAYYLNLIPEQLIKMSTVLINLWPLALIIAGIIFVIDSIKKRNYLYKYELNKKIITLPSHKKAQYVCHEIYFAFGALNIEGSSNSSSQLVYEQISSIPEPQITHQLIGNTFNIKINKLKPYFIQHLRIGKNWLIKLFTNVPYQFNINLHEADLYADLHLLKIEKLYLKADSGIHQIIFGKNQKKTSATIYGASSKLSIIIPNNTFLRLKLLNPFCRLEYPQGDFEKREDGLLISKLSHSDFALIELTVDGPLKNLFIDIDETI